MNTIAIVCIDDDNVNVAHYYRHFDAKYGWDASWPTINWISEKKIIVPSRGEWHAADNVTGSRTYFSIITEKSKLLSIHMASLIGAAIIRHTLSSCIFASIQLHAIEDTIK